MIVISISMSNFQCYYGPHSKNTINFKNGINIITGDNGGGKSKLYDSFYWVLYDQVFNSDDREFRTTGEYKEHLLSDKAKRECQIGSNITAEVILKVQDSRGVEYRLTRIYQTRKLSDREWQSEGSSKLLVDQYKVTRWEALPREKHKSTLDRVIPPHLKPYMWFQGEQVDSLIDFRNKSSLMQVINLLSDISDYDDLIKIVSKGSSKASKEYAKQANKLSKDGVESNRIANELEETRLKITKKKEDLEEYEDEKAMAQSNIDLLINKIDDAENKSKLKNRRRNVEEKTDRAKALLDKGVEGLNNKLFTEFWMLKNAQGYFTKFENKYHNYYTAHNDRLSDANKETVRLPIDMPQPIHINEMLQDQKCFVCGRDAHEGTEEYKTIKGLLDRKKIDPKDLFTNDYSSYFQKLYDNSLSFKHTISQINKFVSKEFSSLNVFRSDIREGKGELRSIEEQFDQLIADDDSENIVSGFKTHTRNVERYAGLIAGLLGELAGLQKKEQSLLNRQDSLVVGEIPRAEKTSNEVYSQLEVIVKSMRKQVFSELVKELESKANDIFRQMTANNTSITGNLSLRMPSAEVCIPEIVDADGFKMSGSNDSNIILIKLSLIMAVVTSKPKWSQNYCLISDAPTSKMSKKYSKGFYESLNKYFKQSIVMTYDFVQSEERDFLRELGVGSVHKIESQYPHGDRADRSDLSIQITEV
jgi:DNA sulfur modification protein DndD